MEILNEKQREAVHKYLAKFGIDLPAKKVDAPVVKLEDIVLADKTILSVDVIEVGSPATFTGEDGVAIPAEGEYKLEDGSTIVCAAGLVTEIKPKEVEGAPAPDAPAESEMKAILSKLSERLDTIEKTNLASKTTLEAELSETKKGLLVALQAIDKIDNTSVALSLESQTKAKAKKAKTYEEMNNHEKLLFNKGK